VRVPPEVDTAARQTNPELFKLVDDIRAEQASLREQLDRVGADREVSAESEAILAEVQVLSDKHGKANKRNQKRIGKEITKLLRKREALVAKETPVMQKLRERLVIADEKLRDIAPEVSDVLRRAQSVVRSEGTTTTGSGFKATGIRFDEVELARIQSVENLRLANTEFTSKIDAEILPEDALSTVADAEDGLNVETQRLNETLDGMDEDARVTAKEIRDADAEATQAEIEIDNDYVAQYKKVAMCVGGRAG